MRPRTARLHVERLESRDLPSTFYVATTGNNNNNGSSGSPWLTIQNAADNVQAGDTVIVRAGNYAGFILGWDAPTAGTAASPITFEADPAAAPGAVVINARNVHTPSGIDLEPGCDYITIMGFTIIGGGGIATYPNRGYGIKVTGNYDRVLNNTITNLDYAVAGIHDNGGNNVLIQGNTITGMHNHGNANLGHGIYVADADGVVIRGNTIHDNDYIGIHINGDPNLVSNALIENNRIYNNGQNGINCDGLMSSTVRNNLIYGYENYGIALYYIDSSGPSQNNVIVNNTVVATSAFSSPGAAVRILDAGTGNTLRNNILLGGGGITCRISDDSMSGLVSDYNVAGNLFQSEDTGATQTLVQWRTQTGQDAHSLVAAASALFANSAGDDYHLKVGSAAVDAGAANNAPTTDFDGKHRPQGSGYDIGAYELPAAVPFRTVFATGSGPGNPPVVNVYSAVTGALLKSITAYGSSFLGGVRVAMGDITGDGIPDIITGAGPTGAPHIKVFDGSTYALVRSFYAYGSTFTGGVWLAAGDVNGDGFADIITGAGAGGGPQVKVFSGLDNSILYNFYAYGASFAGGVQVAAGDINGDLKADIVTGAGAGGGPHVQVFDGTNGQVIRSFFAYGATFLGGVFVTTGDVNGDGKDDIITGVGAGGGPHVKVFSGSDNSVLASFFALSSLFSGGVRVAVADANGDGKADLVAGSGAGAAPRVRVMNPLGGQTYQDFNAYDPGFTGGVFVG